ncbi:uncharacterized protein LOC143828381 isoform X2 [Paroedura picta]|uniref:uncharacterized protein LOC143828381 isoform X2 n=1 Tax=Paroedura picta TaxID=143630 RepID=UPI004057C5CB
MTSEGKIPGSGVANHQGTNSTSDLWMATKDTFLQTRHTNQRLEGQLHCLLKEGDIIRAKDRDLQRNVTAMRAELRRVKKVEKRNIFLEAEIQAGRKKLDEERVSTSLAEQYLKKLKENNERLHSRMSVLSEESAALAESQKIIQQEYLQLSCHVNKLRRQIQECKLSCAEKDEVLAKMKRESRKVEECIKEYEEAIQVLEDREQTQEDKMSGFAEKSLRRQIPFSNNNLNINPWSLMNEIVNAELIYGATSIQQDPPQCGLHVPDSQGITVGEPTKGKVIELQEDDGMRRAAAPPQILWWVTKAWLSVWWLTGIFLTIFLASLLICLLILNFGISNETVTELYHQPMKFMGYTIRPYMQLDFDSALPL